MQCTSSIHFNPILEVIDYKPPDIQQCAVNSVDQSALNNNAYVSESSIDDSDEIESCTSDVLICNEAFMYCPHPTSSLPRVYVTI